MSLKNPVRYPVKYYSWQDDKAPQLSDADGVIKTILKACLVTGYGTKTGAGWTSLFEDDYRIVLRRPLRTGNPPDIKIENGVINGTASHRIVAQDNPNGLEDGNELSSVNFLARDSSCGKEWHCMITDFAFLLCYRMGENGGSKRNAIFIGSTKKLQDSDDDIFFLWRNPRETGSGNANYAYPLLDSAAIFVNARTNAVYTNKNYLTLDVDEKYFNNDFLAQKVLIERIAELPFFIPIPNQFIDTNTNIISINGRNMLRYMNVPYSYDFKRPLYIPLDFWEL